eukprot:jgi/Ulvmu1/9073/UM005_0168.1
MIAHVLHRLSAPGARFGAIVHQPRAGLSFRQMSSTARATTNTSFLSQKEAVAIDEELMGPLGFSVDQLMELAGLSVACSIAAETPQKGKVLVLAGPGNNGGDGLVAARHLHHFGYPVSICYPKRTAKPLYEGLVVQCTSLGLPFLEADEVLAADLDGSYAVIVDALFGFSFRGPPRPPFDGMLRKLADARRAMVASVDVPSGWHVEDGDVEGTGLRPQMLISLTAPKLTARFFEGPHHYLGGRFVPHEIRDKYELRLPDYPGTAMCVKITADVPKEVHSMRNHVTDDTLLLDNEAVAKDPIALFGEWFAKASGASASAEPNAMALATAAEGVASVRVVLLKGFDERGFTFFTNYGSTKAAEIDAGGSAALCFYWEHVGLQVRVQGAARRVPEAESEAYFASRPRGSQLGAWSSEQSSVIPSREVLDVKMKELEEKYAGQETIPKPPFWGGYRVEPTSIEFWHSQPSRTHERLRFRWAGDGWVSEMLSP